MSDEEQAIRKQDEQAIAELAQAGADMDAPHARAVLDVRIFSARC